MIGSRLIRFTLEIVLCLAVYGGCAFAEHPQYPTWLLDRSPPSIWATKMISWLRKLSCIQFTSFDQCVLSAGIRKPTTVMALRLPYFREHVRQLGYIGRCPHGKHAHESLKGRDQTGGFKTAVGKVYPQKMNEVLAEAIFRFAVKTFPEGHALHPLPPDIECFGHGVFAELSVVQPDFHSTTWPAADLHERPNVRPDVATWKWKSHGFGQAMTNHFCIMLTSHQTSRWHMDLFPTASHNRKLSGAGLSHEWSMNLRYQHFLDFKLSKLSQEYHQFDNS